ncbi:MAG: signal peptidase II [bacterium]
MEIAGGLVISSSKKKQTTSRKPASVKPKSQKASVKEVKSKAVQDAIDETLTEKISEILAVHEPKKHLLSPGRSAFNIFFVGWAVTMVDQITKFLALVFLKPVDRLSVLLFDLRYVQNTGAAFGILQNSTLFLTFISLVFVTGALSITVILSAMPKSALAKSIHHYTQHQLGTAGLGLIFGGALGNLLDRTIREYVIDFVDFRVWPVFNFADACIVVGIISLVWVWYKYDQSNSKKT